MVSTRKVARETRKLDESIVVSPRLIYLLHYLDAIRKLPYATLRAHRALLSDASRPMNLQFVGDFLSEDINVLAFLPVVHRAQSDSNGPKRRDRQQRPLLATSSG